jgi:hypothetical protein
VKKLILLALWAPLAAFASPGNDGCIGNCPTEGGGAPVTVTTTNNNANLNNITVKPTIDANARARAEAWAASQAKATSGAYSGGNSQTVVSEGTNNSFTGGSLSVVNEYPSKQRIYNVPNAVAPAVYPTSPCMGSSAVGGSGVGFGVSFGTSWTDDECGIRETARSFNGLGLKDDAVSVLCTSKYAAIAPVCNKQKE